MYKKIYHLSDIHIPLFKNINKYKTILGDVVLDISEKHKTYKYEEGIIMIAGDLVHQKITISNEQILVLSWFLRELEKICKVVIFAGNHDLLENNKERVDTITPIIEMLSLKNLVYLDKELEYTSGCYVDKNITWCLYSIFDEYKRPEIEKARELNPNNKFVGLIHAPLVGSKTDLGFSMSGGEMVEIFFNLDYVLAGDIHLGQELRFNDVKIVYPSSILQHSFGENVSGHGYVIWDVNSGEYTKIDIDSDFGYYKFKINAENDIVNNKEVLVNP
jgi:DNA repair exonuclease SbcCD nuclease subunit